MAEEKIIRVIDTETTGLGSKAQIVEFAQTPIKVTLEDDGALADLIIGQTTSMLAKPAVPISLEAMAIHHIREDMLINEKPHNEVITQMESLKADYWVAHNAAFDRKFFNPEFGEWICTMQVARRIYPDAPSHKNQVLRYWLQLDNHMDEERTLPAHRAGPDTYVTAFLLGKMLASRKMLLTDMVKASGGATANADGDTIWFGRHKGTPWKQIPRDYLRWLSQSGNGEAKEKAASILRGE